MVRARLKIGKGLVDRVSKTPTNTEDRAASSNHTVGCRVCVLGGLQIEANGVKLRRLPTQKTGLLLAYLASFPSRPHPREELIEMLWPECLLDEGRNRLRVAFSAIRRMFEEAGVDPDAVLEVDRMAARINPLACTTDALQFERAARRDKEEADSAAQIAELEAAAALYTGDMLPGFYEEWVSSERHRFTDLHANLLRRIGKQLVNIGEYERAIEYFRTALASDPLSEGMHRTLIRLYMACQRPAAAQRQYETLKAVLARELRTTPSAQTQDLARKLTERTVELDSSNPVSSEPILSTRQPLPTNPTSFVDRSAEMTALSSLLDPKSGTSGRFITVTGPAGVGKSRLVIETIANLQDVYEDRVYYARIAGFESSESVLRSVADALQIGAAPQTEAFSAVAEYLSQGPSLLVLDDADQLGPGALRIVSRLIEWASELRVIITSTRVFEVVDERVLNVKPLPLPSEDMSPADLQNQPSTRLFVDRAKSARSTFRLNDANFRIIISLCRRLEGIPLAIELAANWLRVLTPEDMLVRLENRFDLLRSREEPSTVQSGGLYEALSLSYRLLPEHLRLLLNRLSVLRGYWTEGAAEAICGKDTTIHDILELSLRSFILCDDYFGSMRYRMLDTLRDYVDENLSTDERDELLEAHAAYFDNQAASLRHTEFSEQSRWLNLIDLDYDNYLQALDWSKRQVNFDRGTRLCADLWRYWYERGLYAEGLAWISTFLGQAAATNNFKIEALFGASRLAIGLGENVSAVVFLDQAREISGPMPYGTLTVPVLSTLAVLAIDAHDYERARDIYLEWLSLPVQAYQIWERVPALQGLMLEAKRCDDSSLYAACSSALAEIMASLGDPTSTAPDESVSVSRLFGGYPFLELGESAMSQGDDNTAKDLYIEALDCYKERSDNFGMATAYDHLAAASLRQQDLSAARGFALESLAIRRTMPDHRGAVAVLLTLSYIEDKRGFTAEAGVYGQDALRYAAEYEWILKICAPFSLPSPS